jgi:hypothetical protein
MQSCTLTKYINSHSDVAMGAPEYNGAFANKLRFLHALKSAEGVEEVIYLSLPGKTEASKQTYELAQKALSSHCPQVHRH